MQRKDLHFNHFSAPIAEISFSMTLALLLLMMQLSVLWWMAKDSSAEESREEKRIILISFGMDAITN